MVYADIGFLLGRYQQPVKIVAELVMMKFVCPRTDGELHLPVLVPAYRQAVADCQAAAQRRGFPFMVLRTVFAVGGDIVPDKPEVRPNEPAVVAKVLLGEPVAYLGIESQRAELDGGFEIIPSGVLYRQVE